LRISLGVVLACGVLLVAITVYGVVSCFRLGAEARSLRQVVMESSGQPWRQKLALNAGGITTSLLRQGLSLTWLDPKAQTALQTVRAAQVGIYELPAGAKAPPSRVILEATDARMRRDGWERLLCAADGQNLVAVYVPSATTSLKRVKCSVLVLGGKQMVLASVQVNLHPLLQMPPERGLRRWPQSCDGDPPSPAQRSGSLSFRGRAGLFGNSPFGPLSGLDFRAILRADEN
jgi:hypothetical protein